MELLQRRLDELVAIFSIYSHDLLEAVSPQELLAFLLSGGSEATNIAELAGQPIQLALRVSPPEGHSGSSTPAAVLHAFLPPGYPAEGCTCSVSSMLLPKQWQAQATDHAQQLAIDAAQDGRECLFDLLQATQELAADAIAASCQGEGTATQQRAQLSAAADPGSKGTPGSSCSSAGEVQLALLRIDHMHDRSRYCRTVRKWCAELGLGGQLLFRGQLILALLEGAAGDVRECLVRWRTQPVDVDSKGRPCKERMMDVVAEEHRQRRRFSSFEEVELASFEELRGVLEQAGVADWLPAAVGFQPAATAAAGGGARV